MSPKETDPSRHFHVDPDTDYSDIPNIKEILDSIKPRLPQAQIGQIMITGIGGLMKTQIKSFYELWAQSGTKIP